MPDLDFTVEKAQAVAYAAAPLLNFTLRVSARPGRDGDEAPAIHAVALHCQIRIEPEKRRYAPAEKEKLTDLFGAPSRWGQTLRSMLWTHADVVVPQFSGSTTATLGVPCTFDFNVAATKYFDALQADDVALRLLFSGTIFYASSDQQLQAAPVPWDKEASFRLPVRVWKEMMETYYPNTAWLCLRKDVFDQLHRYKSRHGIPTWETAVERLLAEADEEVRT